MSNRIKKLSMKNFRSFEAATAVDLSQVNLFVGGNGTGKSTVLDAIALGLTGTCHGADTGRGLAELRRKGSKRRFDVQMELRDKDGGFAQVGRSEGDGPRSKAQEHVEDLLGVTGDQARACLYSGELLSLNKQDRQQLIMDLAPAVEVEVPPLVAKLIEAHLALKANTATPGELENWHDSAYGKRRDCKRELSAMGEPEPSAAPEGMEGVTLDELGELKTAIEGGITQLSNERAKLNADVAKVTRSADDPANYREAIATNKDELVKLRELTSENFDDERRRIADDTESVADDAKAFADEREELRNTVSRGQAILDNAAARLTALEGKDGTHCEVCRTKLTAPKLAKVREYWQGIESGATREIDTAAMLLDELAVKDDTVVRKSALVDLVKELDRRGKEQAKTARQIKTLESDIAAQEKTLAEVEATDTPDTTDLEAQAAALTERIGKGQAKLEAVAARAAVLRGEKQHADKRQALEVEHGELDDLVKALGPDGLRKEIATGGGVGEFVAGVVAGMALLGFDGVDFGPLLELKDDPHVNGIPLRHLSRSQQSRFGICFQIAVARATGLGVVAVDNWEQFEPSVMTELWTLLQECGQQVFVFKVGTDPVKYMASAVAANRPESTTRLYAVGMTDGLSSIVLPREATEAA